MDELSIPHVSNDSLCNVVNLKYRLIVYSHYEEDPDEPYFVDYNSMDEALNAKLSYEGELTLSGSHAYSVCGPDVVKE